MKKSVYISLGAVFCVFLIVFIVFIMDLNPKPHTEQGEIPESSVYQYLLKEYMGKLAVFEYGKDAQPQRVGCVHTDIAHVPTATCWPGAARERRCRTAGAFGRLYELKKTIGFCQ